MTPKLTIRSFTNDQYVLDKVFYTNHYKLKGHKDGSGPVVVDIGAHCGYFSFAALSLGARKVYAFEPYPDNYRILLENTRDADLSVLVPHQLAILTSNDVLDFSPPKKMEGTYYDYANLDVGKVSGGPKIAVPCVTLDFALSNLISEHVDILKFNIGYADVFEILLASKDVENRVESIVAEIPDQTEETIKDYLTYLASKGFKESAVAQVEEEEGKFVIIVSKDKIDKLYNIYFGG
jgi:FkbM family methyltransferase